MIHSERNRQNQKQHDKLLLTSVPAVFYKGGIACTLPVVLPDQINQLHQIRLNP